MKHFFRLSFNQLMHHRKTKRKRKNVKLAIIKETISFGNNLHAANRFILNNKGKKLILITGQ